ncbi:tyrosine-type recombinase/integrase [uncultured Veillonella sp.]|uniref:tyrosine-type recombinase/integrase n=1 Tax=uncultured Veillonella sp. TaxID=159268 RepID=UPI00345B87F2
MKTSNTTTAALSIQELSEFLNVSVQTLRKRLRDQGYLLPKNKVGNCYYFTLNDCESFIANNYGIFYNDFVNRYSNGKRNESIMYQIPSGKGIISKETQRSGKTYYYIRNLPLYCDDQGKIIKFRSKGFTSKEEAEAERKRRILDRDNGLYKYHFIECDQIESSKKKVPTGANQSYYDFCIDYFTKATYAEATRKLYLDITKNRIKPFFGTTPISDLSKSLLQQFVDQYSTNIKKTFIVLSLTLKKLHSLDLIPTNFYSSLIKPASTAPKHPKEALTVNETQSFLNYYKGHHLEHCVLLLFQCGLRIGELQSLQWDEIEIIDDCKAKVHVNSSWGETKYGMNRKEPKTHSSKRVIPISSTYTISVLKRARAASKGNLWVAENETGLRPIDKSNFTKRYFAKVGKKLGIEKHLSSHVARHTFISNLVQHNVPYTEIAKLAGHDNTTMIIKVYAHAIQDEEQTFNYVSNLYT